MGFQSKSAKIILIVVLVLILAVVTGWRLGYLTWKPSAPPQTQEPPLGQPVYAPQGQLTAGFPPELILDPQAALAQSYRVKYQENLNQYTATFNSNQSMLSMFSRYKTYLKNNGWFITNEITQYATSRGLYAQKRSLEVSITITKKDSGSEVSVTYILK